VLTGDFSHLQELIAMDSDAAWSQQWLIQTVGGYSSGDGHASDTYSTMPKEA
jgi:hypothetical protein